LEISVEDSNVNQEANPLGNLENVPVFSKRTAKTLLSIQEGKTIVIGGLIQDSKDTVKSGVPLLSKIPVIGALFGTQTYINRKTELLILMTPHVIADINQSDAVTKEFRDKVEGLKLDLEKKEEKEKKKKK
jgi:general secretion pathway protein D